MKKGLVIIFLIVSNLSYLKCADTYEIGDILYVWAKSGLNVRVGPGTDNHVIAKISFGESVLVWGKTDRTYNVMGIDTTNHYRFPDLKVEPIIFKGNWVQIQMLDGRVGYVIDQYLLKYKIRTVLSNSIFEMNIEIVSVDTLFKSPILHSGDALIYKIQREYDGDITELIKINGLGYGSKFSIPNATMEEVLVLFSSSLYDFDDTITFLTKNWAEEIVFSVDICTYAIKQLEGRITVEYECSC